MKIIYQVVYKNDIVKEDFNSHEEAEEFVKECIPQLFQIRMVEDHGDGGYVFHKKEPVDIF